MEINYNRLASVTVANNAMQLNNVSDFSVQSMQISITKEVIFNDRAEELLTRAVNNRTRERNYFRLYCQLLEGEITEVEFEKEIDEHEDDYVVCNDNEATIDDLRTAHRLIDGIKDVGDLDSLVDLFSFNQASVKKCLTATV